MSISRRKFLGGLGALAAGSALAPLIRVRRAHGSHEFSTHRVVVVGIGGGLRNRESLGMAWGATMPNLFGRVPLISGFGAGDAGNAVIAPEYAAAPLVLPTPRSTPLHTQGTLVTNLRYAEGAAGHLQGQACLMSGYYNNLENRADARLPVPTIFEIFRRETDAAATEAWYVSSVGGFYRALQTSDHPGFGSRYAGTFLAPPGLMSPIVPIVTSGRRSLDFGTPPVELPTIPSDPDEDAAVARLRGILDGNAPAPTVDKTLIRADEADNMAYQRHLAEVFADETYEAYYPESVGIGLRANDGGIDATADCLTVYHAERVLERFKPSVMGITLIDVDQCHGDFNGYLRGQLVADALVAHLWDFIQSTEGLRDQTTLIVLPEHGRHLFYNGQNPDSLGRSGVDHGQGDDGDRDVFMLALGPDIKPGEVIAPTGVSQTGRTSGRYETVDAIMTAMTLLGHGDAMTDALESRDARPGLIIPEVLA